MLKEPKDPKAALRLYKAMFRFSSIEEIREMAKWLESELFRLDAANRNEEVDAEFRQRQGACQVLDYLLSMVRDSSERARKLEVVVQKSN